MTNHLQNRQQQSLPARPGPPPPITTNNSTPIHQTPCQRRNVDIRIPAIEKYAYCLCLHVKPATIFIAIFKLVRALLFASILLNNEFAMDHGDMGFDERSRSTVIAVSIFSRIIIASVAALAIYAVLYNRAALLMPLYAVLLVDFFFSLPVLYNRELPDPHLPSPVEDMKTLRDSHLPRYSFMLFSTLVMIVRIYFLCVIWKCYRYLRLIELVTPIARGFNGNVYPHITQNMQYPIVRVLGNTDSTDLSPTCGAGVGLAPPSYDSVACAMKPPNYDEAVKSDANLYPISQSPTSQQQQDFTTVDLTSDNRIPSSDQHQDSHNQRHQRYPSNQIVPTSDP